jgi:hypothetical protein
LLNAEVASVRRPAVHHCNFNMFTTLIFNFCEVQEKTKADDLVSVMCTHVPDVITQLSSRDSKCVADMVCIVVRAFATDRQVT